MNTIDLANLIFPNIDQTVADYEAKYPERDLNKESVVSRFAPSPTGFVHFGSLYTSFIAAKVAKDTQGLFYVRIEDTDQERKVENGINNIIRDLKNFSIKIDEGVVSENTEIGSYGPYIQSQRRLIYQTYAKDLIIKGLAYPCFCSKAEIENLRTIQEQNKEELGYYGKYAKCRTLSIDEQIRRVTNGEPFVIRLKSNGDINKKVRIKDLVKGELEFPENNIDIVIIKSDGLPTYHFAHAIDDHLMHTTHVIRGDEWLSSLPIHIQLFNTLNFKMPKYAHLSPIMIQDGDSRRKLSKRKDKEAAVSFYHEMGIPNEAVALYLMTIANSNFEAWYQTNPNASIDDFKLDFKKISPSGALFDMDKLLNISKNYLSYLTKDDFYERLLHWSAEFDLELHELMTKYKDATLNYLNIERERKKPRKDYACYKEIKDKIWYMYDELFFTHPRNYEFDPNLSQEELSNILNTYFNDYYDENDTEEEWFEKMKDMGEKMGYASNIRDYKENSSLYKGSIADISNMIRVAITTKSATPNLYDILKIIGRERIAKRIELLK